MSPGLQDVCDKALFGLAASEEDTDEVVSSLATLTTLGHYRINYT